MAEVWAYIGSLPIYIKAILIILVVGVFFSIIKKLLKIAILLAILIILTILIFRMLPV